MRFPLDLLQGGRSAAAAAAWAALLAAALLAPPAAQAAEWSGPRRAAAAAADAEEARVIVKYRSASALAQAAAGQPRHAGRLGRQLALPLEDGHVLGRRTQSLRGRGLTSAALAARLAQHPEVEWAVPVGRKTIQGVLPNDPFFADGQTSITPAAGQWYLRAPDATRVAAINAVGAWAITEGSAAITVAVLDTGVRFDHPDFVAAGGGSKLWPGYDFVSRSSVSNDGNGRDSDASDPGDWSVSTDDCGAKNSSWHGTQVAGLIGAATDNGIGMASVGRRVMVLPVRVLGKCGGFDDDIIAGMRWAAGLANTAACNAAGTAASRAENCNPHPARVINLSLGSSGSCSAGYRDAVAELTAAGVVVVAAAGNGDTRIANSAGRAVNEPANCAGVIAVSGLRHAGTKVGYSNLGPEVALAAPAGNCVTLTSGSCVYPLLTTYNSGLTAPGAGTYSNSFTATERGATLGTSFASPLVAGAVGLMLSVDTKLTPSQIKATLQATARPFPTTGAQEDTAVACRAPGAFDQIECYCTSASNGSPGTCGAGMLDAGAAVSSVQLSTLVPVAVIAASSTAPVAGSSVTLQGTGSTASAGRSISQYRWSLLSGAGLASFTGATDGSSASLATSSPGTVVVQLTVTDSVGASSSASQTLTVAAAPVVVMPTAVAGGSNGGGGGGAMGAGWLLGLALAVLALRRWPA